MPHKWDKVLFNTPGLTLKRHAPAVGQTNSNQPNIPSHFNQPNIPTHSGQTNAPMHTFTGSEHVHRTSQNAYKVQHFSSPSDLMKSSCWLDESLSSIINVVFHRIYQLLHALTNVLVLAYHNFSRPFELETGTSLSGWVLY